MELNHFSSVANFLRIISSGYIDRTFSRLRLQQRADERPVVWLIANPSPSHDVQAWATGSLVLNGRSDFDLERLDSYNQNIVQTEDRTRIKIVVDLNVSLYDPLYEAASKCYQWDHWSRSLNRDEDYALLQKTRGGDWKSWHVFGGRIHSRSWVTIADSLTDQIQLTQEG